MTVEGVGMPTEVKPSDDARSSLPEFPAQHDDDAIVNTLIANRRGQTIALADDAHAGNTAFLEKRSPVWTT